MKIASFNIQNLFHRDKSLINSNPGHCLTNWITELDNLMRKKAKISNDFDRIRELSFLLGFEKTEGSRYAVFRKRNGALYFHERGFSHEMRASELTDWNGWVALQTIPIHCEAVINKARAIAEIDADILILQEVEDRASLVEFNKKVSMEFGVTPYQENMVIEGNNTKGLGMGIMTKNGYCLDTIKHHIHDYDNEGKNIFEIDCPEYTIITPSGESITIVNSFLSLEESRRNEQSIRVANICQRLRSEGKENIIVSGTLNDVSYGNSLSPLLRETDLKDISKHGTFNVDFDMGKDAGYFRMGAYRMGVNIQQKDYLLLSPKLYSKLNDSGLNRRGVWQDKKPNWSLYPSIKQKHHAASEHPLIWGVINID